VREVLAHGLSNRDRFQQLRVAHTFRPGGRGL
jgi:hypothetical protein